MVYILIKDYMDSPENLCVCSSIKIAMAERDRLSNIDQLAGYSYTYIIEEHEVL